VLQNIIEAPIHVLGVPRDEAVATARKYLARVDLVGMEDRYPAHLSGGQQQRVAIARALAMEPEVMLFDEPTSALDPELVGEVLELIRDLKESGTTIIMATHELSFARDVADWVVFLDQGVVAEEGEAAEFFKNPKQARTKEFLTRLQQR
jgi:ABC-type histidine transport system ATPase subunit